MFFNQMYCLVVMGLVLVGMDSLHPLKADEVRHYQEVFIDARAAFGMNQRPDSAAPASLALSWTTPSGWQEQKGEGMRMVSFAIPGSFAEEGLCTIVALPGLAGDLDSNLLRWAKQLGLTQQDEEIVRSLKTRSEHMVTEGTISGHIYDFSPLVLDPSAPSMLSGMFECQGQMVFVKMTGSKQLLNEQKERFEGLCQSLRV